MKREVAAPKGREFPRSMSDFKPGDMNTERHAKWLAKRIRARQRVVFGRIPAPGPEVVLRKRGFFGF